VRRPLEISFEEGDWERDAERDPDSKAKRREEGRAFQREGGTMVAKDLVWALMVLTHRTKGICQSKDCNNECFQLHACAAVFFCYLYHNCCHCLCY